MKKIFNRMISILLVISTLLTTIVPAYAAGEEEYICELRLIYADSYDEASDILEDSEFYDYKILKENLNKDTGKKGVWLAYKTTTDIEDAITDLSVMQMDGGYKDGNYQEMIKESYEEYISMGETYLEAIDYFLEAYNAGNFLAKSAYRQLNFYTVIDEEASFDGQLLGDIFYDGIDAPELATIFMQGNSYALNNIRALIAMGVAYNEDGKTYMQKVEAAAAEMVKNPDVYKDNDYDELAELVAPTLSVFKDMFVELAAYESELNYEDEEITETELYYAEYMAIAEMMKNVKYLDGKTLYQFCEEYNLSNPDYTLLYPLVAALNEGQVAMTKVAHYYDVVRYSISGISEEEIEKTLDQMEESYGKNPFNVYTGVDRSIYEGSFALTTEAYRSDAYTESGLANAYFGEGRAWVTGAQIASGVIGAGLWISSFVKGAADKALLTNKITHAADRLAFARMMNAGQIRLNGATFNTQLTELMTKHFPDIDPTIISQTPFVEKYQIVMDTFGRDFDQTLYYGLSAKEQNLIMNVNHRMNEAQQITQSAQETAKDLTQASRFNGISAGAAALHIIGGAMMIYSAISLGLTRYNYYHPDYDDIPIAMVNLIDTIDGDRYIKYDVVHEAEAKSDGKYAPGDLNAFEGQRWNALYYTKSYEAGKPLLADSFSVSNNNNIPKENYAPVHRFGEVICYDLNKYNFDDDTSIYLSVKQSKKQKSAVSDVPEVVGSLFSSGFLFLAGGVGALAGVGGTLGTQAFMKKKRATKNKNA